MLFPPCRFANFKNSLTRIASRNAADSNAKFAINKFSDMSVEEFKAKYLNYKGTGKRNVKVCIHYARVCSCVLDLAFWSRNPPVRAVQYGCVLTNHCLCALTGDREPRCGHSHHV